MLWLTVISTGLLRLYFKRCCFVGWTQERFLIISWILSGEGDLNLLWVLIY
uniref:Uncharacterized protein n=1 Tax=Rhizophora mucronata TaxID=61149 RepID=A0A2P2IN93_RHIMU